jgi:hypothetical protein
MPQGWIAGALLLASVLVGCGERTRLPATMSAGTGGGAASPPAGTGGSAPASAGSGGAATSVGGSGGDAAAGTTGSAGTTGTAGTTGSAGAAAAEATLEYSGAVDRGGVQISAPILPRTTVIYQPFPATLEGEQTMAHDASLLFDWLLPTCAPLYPKITLDPSGAGLTASQLGENYGQVGRCAYEQYVAKPYWIPKLVGDVDICGTEMGTGWRLITEADLASLSAADFQAVSDVWNHFAPDSEVFGTFYGSLAIWVRANDGTIAAGTLDPAVTGSRVSPLGTSPTSTDHYEGSLGLRCIRRNP